MSLNRFVLSVVAWLGLAVAPAARADVGRWSPVGPFGCGFDCRLAVAPSDSRVVYAASRWGFIFRTSDRGGSWEYRGQIAPLPGGLEARVAVDPRAPGVLYALWENRFWISRDGGASFAQAPVGAGLGGLAFDAAGNVYAGGGELGRAGIGISRSTDSGRTWTRLSRSLLDSSFFRLAVDPRRPQTLLAAFLGNAIQDRRLYRSLDAGATWRPAALPPGVQVYQVMFDPAHAGVALVQGVVYGPTNRSVSFRSTDSGATFRAMRAVGPVTAGPRGALYGAGFKSLDGGATWRPLRAAAPGDIVADPKVAGTLYALALKTVFQSTDDGATWRAANQGLTGADAADLKEAPAGGVYCDDDGVIWQKAPAGPWRLVGQASEWGTVWSTDLRGESLWPVAGNPAVLYYVAGLEVRKSTDGGRAWRKLVLPGLYRDDVDQEYYSALRVDPSAPATIALSTSLGGTGYYYLSTDGGRSFRQEALGHRMLHPRLPGSLFRRGPDGGSIERSRDRGATWQRIDQSLAGPYFDLMFDPGNARRFYIWAYSPACGGDALFATEDDGDTWIRRVCRASFPAGFGTDLVLTPASPAVFYGTSQVLGEGGRIHRSEDGGRTWSEVPVDGLPPLRSLFPDPHDPKTLYAATNGRGVWAITLP